MKKYLVCFTLSLAMVIGISASVSAGNVFDIQRIRIIPNPGPGLIKGEEVLEVTFILHVEGWVPGVGWSLRYYDKRKKRISTWRTAYFSAAQNNRYLLREDYFKGGIVWVALFPILDPEAAYMTIAIGDGFTRNVQLFPYTALLQNFNIPIKAIDREILSSDYIVFEEEVEKLN